MKHFLVTWQAHNHTGHVEKIRASSSSDAKKRIINKYQNYPGFEGCEIKVRSVKVTSAPPV